MNGIVSLYFKNIQHIDTERFFFKYNWISIGHCMHFVLLYITLSPIKSLLHKILSFKFYKFLNYHFAIITYLDAEVTSFNSFIRAYIVKRLL